MWALLWDECMQLSCSCSLPCCRDAPVLAATLRATVFLSDCTEHFAPAAGSHPGPLPSCALCPIFFLRFLALLALSPIPCGANMSLSQRHLP